MSSWMDKFKEGFTKGKSHAKRKDAKEEDAYKEYAKFAKEEKPKKRARRSALRDIIRYRK